MATDSNGNRRVFSFPRPLAAPLPPVAAANTLATSNGTAGHSNMLFTRDSVHKTRLDPPEFQATIVQIHPGHNQVEAKASSTKNNLQELSGFAGFVRSNGGLSSLQAPVASPMLSFPTGPLKGPSSSVSKASNLLFPTPAPDTMTASRQKFVTQARPQQLVLPVNMGQKQILQQQRGPLHPQNKVTVARSSTPAPIQDASNQDAKSNRVDYEVFETLMQSQRKKEKLLEEKEDLLIKANQEMELMHRKNAELTADLERMKEKSRAYIQQCDKLVLSAQNDAKTYQESSRESYARCIEEIQANLPDLQSLKAELTERMENIQFQLDEEHQHRARIGPELLHELEKSKHTADFLRDKLEAAAIDLANANIRLEELANASSTDKVTLSQALMLLEDTKKELAASRGANFNNGRLRSDEIEALLEKNSRAAMTQISDLQRLNQTLKDTVGTKEDDLRRLAVNCDEIKRKLDGLKGLPDELGKLKGAIVEKDRQLVVLTTEKQVDRTRIDDLAEQVKKSEQLKTRLEEALCRAAALEAQQSAHLINCKEQKAAVEQLEKELTLARSQYAQAQLDLKQSNGRYTLLENGHEDLKATSRMAKQEYIDMQTKLEEAQEYAKKQQNIVKEQQEKAAEERTRLGSLLEQAIQALKKSSDDLAAAQAEKKTLELVAANDVERAALRAQLVEYKKHASAEKSQLEASIVLLEKELQGSISSANELRGNITSQKMTLEERTKEMSVLSSDNGRVMGELDASRAKYQELSDSFAKAEAVHGAEKERQSLDKDALEARMQEAERNLALTKEELGEARLQVQFLSNQAVEYSRLQKERVLESSLANDRWLKIETKMDHLTADLSDAKSSLHNAVEITSTLVAAQESNVDNSAVEAVQFQLSGLQVQLEAATARNIALEEMSRTTVDRHKRGELTEQESSLVKLVAASAMQIHEKERVQGANDLRRRDTTIQGLQRRIMDLEKQLAGRLERKSPNGQLMMMADVLHSSPLSIAEEGGGLMQQRVLGTTTTPARHSPLNHMLPADRFTVTRAGLHHPVGQNHAVTFAKLNQASSEDAEDDDTIRQFSDKRVDEGPGPLPTMTRPMKRGRDEETGGINAGKGVGTRATRRRKVSTAAVVAEDVTQTGGGQKGGVSEGRVAGGGGEGVGTAAVAKYKAAQRGKTRR